MARSVSSSLSMRRVAHAFDALNGRRGAFDQLFRDLLDEVTPCRLAEIGEAYDLAADEIEVDPKSHSTGREFEAFYAQALQRMHYRALGLTNISPSIEMSGCQAERAFRATFPGGRAEALDVARREGLRRIVLLIRDHAKREVINLFVATAVSSRFNMPAPIQNQIIGLVEDSLGFRQMERGRS